MPETCPLHGPLSTCPTCNQEAYCAECGKCLSYAGTQKPFDLASFRLEWAKDILPAEFAAVMAVDKART